MLLLLPWLRWLWIEYLLLDHIRAIRVIVLSGWVCIAYLVLTVDMLNLLNVYMLRVYGHLCLL